MLNVIDVVRHYIFGDGNDFVMETFFHDTRFKEFPMAHVQVKRMSDGSHVIHRILKVVKVVRHYLVMERLKECPGVDLIFHLSSYC